MSVKKLTGFSLIEVLVATAVTMLALVSVSAAVTYSIKNSRFSKHKTESLRYAQDALEFMRQQRDVFGWDSFWQTVNISSDNDSVSYCLTSLPSLEQGLAGLEPIEQAESCTSIADTNYTRTMTVTLGTGSPLNVDVISNVSWTEGNEVYETPLSTKFYQW